MRIVRVLCLSFLLMMTQGCAFWGVSLTLTAKENDFPISFSEGIFGYNNELIVRDGYEVVHHFTMKKSAFNYNFLHYLIGERFDLSDEFEEVVRLHNGEAIVNLKITGKAGGDSKEFLASVITGILTVGLIAPLLVDITIEGDVIRINATTTSQNDSIPPRFSSIPE